MATEPAVLSAFWLEYFAAPDLPRQRCICGCNSEIPDGRLVFVGWQGLTQYQCWMRRNAGDDPAPVRVGLLRRLWNRVVA